MRELFAVGCLLIGGWCLMRGLRSVLLGLRSRSWPEVNGVIRKAKVLTSRSSEGDDVSWQELEYTYSVGGRPYRGTRVRIGVPAKLASSGEPSQLFRRGERVPVYYSRSRPSVSALRRGTSPFVLITLITGGVVLWVGVGLLR
ncbi:MAG: serine/threonine protein kinase, bacterial [Acidobacteriota bacterium]|jgi:hypothetical protein|nr:serine/threonine protein kinase, bacterial [Acidobacteriota bacterium]